MTKTEIATIKAVNTCPHEKYVEVSVWPLLCSRCHVSKEFIKGYHAGRAELASEVERANKADGMANEINILTKENRALQAENQALRSQVEAYKDAKHIRTDEWLIRYEDYRQSMFMGDTGYYGYRDEWEGGSVGPFKTVAETLEALKATESKGNKQ